MNPKPDLPLDDEPTIKEDPTEPFVRVVNHAPRYVSSPWSAIPQRPMILTHDDEVDFEGAIESLTVTQPLEWEDLVDWSD